VRYKLPIQSRHEHFENHHQGQGPQKCRRAGTTVWSQQAGDYLDPSRASAKHTDSVEAGGCALAKEAVRELQVSKVTMKFLTEEE
jgi:hypothetical protein